MSVWTIYCHIHTESGRRYIGLTKVSMMRRWNQHVLKSRTCTTKAKIYFCNAIRKYGKDAFSHKVLEVCHHIDDANLNYNVKYFD